MKKPRKNYQTQWSGQFGAAHELSRRGYWVTFTTGNAPAVDLLCQSPGGVLFPVQVKSLSSRTSFLCQKALLERADKLFFILVVLPSALSERPEYFILNHVDFRQVMTAQDRACRETEKKLGRPLKEFSPGFNYSVLAKFTFRDAWEKLPH
jgi:hypothetical protein